MPHPPATRVRWTILALILFASFISYMVRSNLSVLADFMGEDLGLSATQLGYIFSAFAAGYALFQLPGGMLGNRYGGRWLVTMMAIAWFVLTALTAMISAHSFWATGTIVLSLVVLRFLVGVTNAPIFPVTAGGTIANWFPIGGWGLPMGLQVAALSLGAALSAPLLVWLAEEYGWRGALLATAPASLVLAVVWWRYVRDFPKDHDGVNEGELALIDANRPPPEARPMPGAWKSALANRNILLLTISYFCASYVFYLFFSWFFYYLVEIKDFGNQQAGLFTSAQWILGAIAGTAGGALCDTAVRRLGVGRGPRWLAILSLVLCGTFLLAGALAQDVHLAVFMLCLSFGFVQLSDSAYWVAAIAVAGRQSQIATGVLNTGGNIVGFAGGLVVPILAEWFSWQVAMASGAVMALLGAGLWLFIHGDRPMNEPK